MADKLDKTTQQQELQNNDVLDDLKNNRISRDDLIQIRDMLRSQKQQQQVSAGTAIGRGIANVPNILGQLAGLKSTTQTPSPIDELAKVQANEMKIQ